LAQPKDLFAFDYDLKVKILEYKLSTGGGNFWFRSFSLNLDSNGTFASDDEVRNGTQSSLGVSANPYYFVAGLIYRGEFLISYQVETELNAQENKLLDIVNGHIKVGLEAEIPLTNYPIYLLHTTTGYARLAMPFTLSLHYLPKGVDEKGSATLARLDTQARYELAFSPFFIVQGEGEYSRFFDAPTGFEQNAFYYSVAFAQDLDEVKKTFSFLSLIIGESDEARGKHFIFYRISSGRKAPGFRELSEGSFGFGTSF